MEIAFFEVKEWEEDVLRKKFKKHKLRFFNSHLNEENISQISNCEAISVFIYSKISKEILDKLPKLRLISTRSTGFDHIDLASCRKRGIIVNNVPYYGENTVAEHTFALILALSRNIHKSYLRTLTNDFCIEGLKGFDLKGKILGVMGTGHIGAHVIRIARGFEMNVIAYDHRKNQSLAKNLGFRYTSLNEVLKRSDIISLHLPLTKDTKHLIGERELRIMKKGTILINTSRGEIVNTEDLLKALNNGHLGGAGIDVIEGEALIKEERELLNGTYSPESMKQIVADHQIIRNENVVFTPHIAFYSQEALERILNTTIENIESFLKKKPENTV